MPLKSVTNGIILSIIIFSWVFTFIGLSFAFHQMGVIDLTPIYGSRTPTHINAVIYIDALTTPLVYNVTSVTAENGTPLAVDSFVARETIVSEGQEYLVYRNLTLQRGKIYKLVFFAVETTHGLYVEGLLDYQGRIINLVLKEGHQYVIYLQPKKTGTYRYECNYFCSVTILEGDEMEGTITVTE